MQQIDKEAFAKNGAAALAGMLDALEQAPTIALSSLAPERSALVVVDVINGFVRQGPLSSPRVEDIIVPIARLLTACKQRGIASLAFADSHGPLSPEFDAFPTHCLTGSVQAELVDELKEAGGYELIEKNSTNGFLEEGFQRWLAAHPQADTFIVTGDCTDICVLQFCLTLKTWFNTHNRKSRVIVPVSMVETYDAGAAHDAALENLISLHLMAGAGVEIVKTIEL